MDKRKIVHFVGFVTPLAAEEFTPLWENYMKRSLNGTNPVMLQVSQHLRGMFKYISQQESLSTEAGFAFLQESGRSGFPDRKARVVQAGGYLADATNTKHSRTKDEVKIFAFLGADEYDIAYYRSLDAEHLNIYAAYFENCAYSYVLEFFQPADKADDLLSALRQRPGVEAAHYEECRYARASKKVSRSVV